MNHPEDCKNYLVLLVCFFCFTQVSYSQKRITYNLVADFGAKPDNKTDNYIAFKKAAAILSKAGGGVLIIPKGNYYIAAHKMPGGDPKNQITDIIYRNCKGLSIEGNNSVIRLNGNFSRNRDYQTNGLPWYYSLSNSVCPFKFVNCKDVSLKNITINGEVDKMVKQDNVVEGESYGVQISDDEPSDTSSRIVFKNVTTHHFAADGFLIRSNGKDIEMNRCTSYNNARQGLSIVKGSNIKCLNSTFDSTGFTGGKYGWHAPGAGIDVENEFGPGKLNNVLIQNCTIRGNKGFQIVTTLPSDKVIIDSCFIADSSGGYADGLNGVGMYSLHSILSNCIIFATIQVDLADQIYRGEVVQQFRNNIVYSGWSGILSASFSRPANIVDNIFIMLPNPNVHTFFPYVQNGNGRFNNNITVVHADRIKKEPNLVTALAQGAIEATNDFWLMNGYKIPKLERKKNYYFPALNGTISVSNQFFPDNEKIVAQDYAPKKMLTDMQVDKILAYPLFAAYKQKKFTREYLVQADMVRKYTRSIIRGLK